MRWHALSLDALVLESSSSDTVMKVRSIQDADRFHSEGSEEVRLP